MFFFQRTDNLIEENETFLNFAISTACGISDDCSGPSRSTEIHDKDKISPNNRFCDQAHQNEMCNTNESPLCYQELLDFSTQICGIENSTENLNSQNIPKNNTHFNEFMNEGTSKQTIEMTQEFNNSIVTQRNVRTSDLFKDSSSPLKKRIVRESGGLIALH